MHDPVATLEPRTLWEHFASLTRVPRPSKHEEAAVAWVLTRAREHGLEAVRDDAGNVVVRVPASEGREKAPVVILQSHLDMVCEKNRDVEHDFMKDPIRTRVVGEWVQATGTTLGADNGIGVAACLAAATDPSAVHGPLDLLFTIDEETGLTGAQRLDPAVVRGRTLLNLDSEEDGVIFVGCAGGTDTRIEVRPARVAPSAGAVGIRLEIAGLRGGHSGLNIHEGRGNALKLVARILFAAAEAGVPFEIAEVHGGSKHNAIPREAEAVLTIPPDAKARFQGVVTCSEEAFRSELRGVDDGLTVKLLDAGSPVGAVLAEADRDRLLQLLLALPHGLLALSRDLPGLTETSSNLAVVDTTAESIRIVTSSRSSVASALRGVLESVRAAGRLSGADVETMDGYPGWQPNMASPVLAVVREVYRRHWSRDPHVTAIHAGLECGLLGQKVPGLDMVSFGPQIEGAHSPDERVHVASVGRFWNALKEVLDRLSA